MMDSRHQSASDHEGYAFHPDSSFNPDTKEPFADFFSNGNNPAFGSQWGSGNFATHQESVNGYGPANHSWPHSSVQHPSSLSASTFPQAQSQTFARGPNAYEYPNFGSASTTALSNPAFDPALGYGHATSNIDPRLSYAGSPQNFQPVSNQNQTISPQALQNHPNAYDASNNQKLQKVQSSGSGSSATQRASAINVPRQPPITREEWHAIASKLPSGRDAGVFTIRDTEALATSTNGKRLHGFALISKNYVEVDTGKTTHVRVNKRRAKAEIRRLLIDEKGVGPWNPARGPILKKLKVSATKSAIARSGVPSARTPSTPESTSPSESASDSETEGGSRYGSESEPESPQEPSPLPPVRPKDAGEAAEYDVVEAVWSPRRPMLTADAIRTSLTKYWAVIKTIRDKWKEHVEALKKAEDAKDMALFSKSKRLIDEQRRVLDSCIRSTLKYGHPDIVNKLGENPFMLLVFYQFLAERIKEGEYGGSFIAGILELLARWTSVDQATLEKTKLDKVLPKLIKKGDLQGKALAQQILDSAANPVKPPSTTPQSSSNNVGKVANGIQRPGSATGGGKVLTNDLKASLLAKNNAGAAAPLQKLTATQMKKQLLGKTGTKPGLKTVTTTAPPVRVKTNHITAKPSSMFASLQSASKKPGSTGVIKAKEASNGNTADRKETLPVSTSATLPAPAKPSFSFAETMANLNKTKEKTPEKIEVDQPPETEEQRQKRLRKEERRKLRVSFKSDEDLVQIKLFMHDPEEELGHDDSMTRDVGDTRGEGQMLKMHKELEDMDEDEDYAPEEPLADWVFPSLADFSDIDPQDRKLNYETRGGARGFESNFRADQAEREKNTLMVIYTHEADIPPSPREPSGEHDGDSNTEQDFGDPSEQTRAREQSFYSKQNVQPSSSAVNGLPGFDTSKISDLLASLKANQQQPSPPQPAAQAPASNLEAIFGQFAGNQQHNNQIPAPPMQAPQMSQPYPTASSIDMQAIMASLANPNQAQPSFPAPFPTQNPPDIQSLLAQLNPQLGAQTQNHGSYNNAFQQNDDDSRKRQLDDEGNSGFNRGKKQKHTGAKKPFNGIPTLPCKFWQEGKCLKGSDCTFVHGERG